MRVFPDSLSFAQTYDVGSSQVVWTKLSADLYTPVAVALAFEKEPFCCLFESVEGGANRARYSFITLRPDLMWRCVDGKANVSREPDLTMFEEQPGEVFDSLRALLLESSIDIPEELPSMVSGLFGFMGYDMVRHMERLPSSNEDTIGIPEGLFIRPQIVIVFDSVKDEMIIVTPVFVSNLDASVAYENAKARIDSVFATIKQSLADLAVQSDGGTNKQANEFSVTSNLTAQDYHQMVEKAKEYILAGDIFQVVPSQRFTVDFEYSAFDLYRSLRRLNPSPFSFFMKMEDFALVGSSPEILVRLKEGKVTVRPIAGTRKRGANAQEDQTLAEDLLSDDKELAEHLMLVDLGRNDVGRVAKTGSVKVTQSKVIEYYSHVMHIVSNVEGDIAEHCDALDAMIAGFPVGTVTGAPKIRAMEIIDELENESRSFYAGGVGYFSAAGDMDTCITLRTGLVKDGKLYVQAGGGVVADSDPDFEYQESCNKANAVLNAAKELF